MPRTRRWRCNVWRSPECQPVITHNGGEGGRRQHGGNHSYTYRNTDHRFVFKKIPYMHFVRLGSSHKRLEISAAWQQAGAREKLYSLHRKPPCVCFGHLYFAVAARSLSSYLQILANCFLSRSETGKPENRHQLPSQ